MGDLNNLNFTVGNVPWKIFRVNAIYFAAFGRVGEGRPPPNSRRSRENWTANAHRIMAIVNQATKELQVKIVYYGPGMCGKTTNLVQVRCGHQRQTCTLRPQTGFARFSSIFSTYTHLIQKYDL